MSVNREKTNKQYGVELQSVVIHSENKDRLLTNQKIGQWIFLVKINI